MSLRHPAVISVKAKTGWNHSQNNQQTNRPTNRRAGHNQPTNKTSAGFRKRQKTQEKVSFPAFTMRKTKLLTPVSLQCCAQHSYQHSKCLKQAKHVHMLATTGELGEVTMINFQKIAVYDLQSLQLSLLPNPLE